MSIPGFKDGASTTLGSSIGTGDTSLTLASATTFPSSGRIWLNVSDTELISGDISGTTVSNLTRAAAPYKGVSTGQVHTSGDAVLLVAAWGAMQGMFPTKIDEYIFPSAGSNITFPTAGGTLTQAYRNLMFSTCARGDTSAVQVLVKMQFNGDTGANYIWSYDQDVNATVTGSSTSGATEIAILLCSAATAPANYAGIGTIFIPNYSGTTFAKAATGIESVQVGAGTAGAQVSTRGGNWSSTAAITSIKLFAAAGNFVTGSTFSLYGLP